MTDITNENYDGHYCDLVSQLSCIEDATDGIWYSPTGNDEDNCCVSEISNDVRMTLSKIYDDIIKMGVPRSLCDEILNTEGDIPTELAVRANNILSELY